MKTFQTVRAVCCILNYSSHIHREGELFDKSEKVVIEGKKFNISAEGDLLGTTADCFSARTRIVWLSAGKENLQQSHY